LLFVTSCPQSSNTLNYISPYITP
jgi:hypothetical protein